MKRPIVNISLLVILIINTIVFAVQFNNVVFISKLIPIFVDSILLVIIAGSIYLIYKCYQGNFKYKMVVFTAAIILNIIIGIFNFSTSIFDNMIAKITKDEIIYTSTIIVRKDSYINSIDNLRNIKIGISENTNDYENYKLGYNYLKKNNSIDSNTFYKYSDYTLAISDLLNGNIDAVIISGNYLDLYDDYFDNLEDSVKEVIKPLSISVKKVKAKKKSLTEPITLLVIGADGQGGSTYNADVLILMTINPKTKNVVMVDVVRDTYAYNLGNNKMDKITHAGWYSTENVVNTVSNLFDINIDYYVKFNFTSVKELVDLVGGVEIDVPYRYQVDKYYVEPGVKRLNGEETLELARARKENGATLFTRGDMQMNIIEQIVKQTDGKFLLTNFFKFSDILEDSISTNMSKEDLYYYIQKYIVLKDDLVFSHNRLNGTESTYYHDTMKKELYTYIPDEGSLNELKSLLKINLEK